MMSGMQEIMSAIIDEKFRHARGNSGMLAGRADDFFLKTFLPRASLAVPALVS
jgi:hypothetical protein